MISSGRAAEIGYWSILAQPFYIKIAVKDHPHLASTREKVAIASSQMKQDQNVSELYSKNLSSGRELYTNFPATHTNLRVDMWLIVFRWLRTHPVSYPAIFQWGLSGRGFSLLEHSYPRRDSSTARASKMKYSGECNHYYSRDCRDWFV